VSAPEPARGNGPLLAGVDIGTSSVKAAVVTCGGEELSWGKAPTPWAEVATGAECEPGALLERVFAALAAALRGAPEGPVASLGVTSFAETVVFLGREGSPVGPCIAWHDTRGEEEAKELAEAFGAEAFSGLTGLRVSPVCTLVKLAWLARRGFPGFREPPTLALPVAGWVVSALGGERVFEASLASRTGALCLAERAWWKEALEWAGTSAEAFPPVVQAGEPAGRVVPHAVTASPLERLAGATLTLAGHDHLSVAAGLGAVGPAQVLDSCGTAEALVRASAPLDSRGVLGALGAGLTSGWHTLPGQYALMSGHSLGLLLERVLRLLRIDGEAGLAALDREAASLSPGKVKVSQERPFGEPSVTGFTEGTPPAALWAAALDSVSERAERTIRAMDAVAGPAAELVLGGGWARLPGLRRRKAGLLPSVRWPAVMEAGARGAALFGGCAAGIFASAFDFPVPPDRPLDS
jgi:sugar (pentulose or hexulose) kinase